MRHSFHGTRRIHSGFHFGFLVKSLVLLGFSSHRQRKTHTKQLFDFGSYIDLFGFSLLSLSFQNSCVVQSDLARCLKNQIELIMTWLGSPRFHALRKGRMFPCR